MAAPLTIRIAVPLVPSRRDAANAGPAPRSPARSKLPGLGFSRFQAGEFLL